MKKAYLYLGVLISVLMSCSGGGDGDGGPGPDPDVENTAPTVPTQVYPLSNTLCIDNNVVFEWNASTDSEGNAITYRVEVSESSDFSSLAHDVSSSSTSRVITLDKGKSYYWRLKARDIKGAESAYSSVSQFLTEGDGVSNHLPFAPELVGPALNSEIDGTSTTLSWTASDVDGDTLSYDVYLDTNSNPTTKVSEGQSGTTYEATGLSAASTYYFKIVVKDGNGGTTIGQIWSFTTK
ncbi:fibronectin type III domain-containing protein [Seonamhaeicola sediminis]|uniref:Fibronectin type III domain-containing protein n=1 Tax=Seonamhaeicola sediminis TaxID=2528206 RepID=A0A562YIC0_9FLAO|nr:fibronectin type III domain-containing protein [Seonamhaeicola sediminis]TWO34518.1 fibronectin type III domain-containing protein [Seonamhaeicola sediminis]